MTASCTLPSAWGRAMAADAEALLRSSRRPLVIGMGGGGDVVGALATAEAMRLYDDAEPLVGGLTWERRPIDPVPGPRRVEEIEGGELAPGVLLAGPNTRVRDRDVHFAEARMAAYLGRPTLLMDIHGGPTAVADGLGTAVGALDRDLVVFVDVGGDVLAQGDEPGLRSPLCDAVMLAAGGMLAAAGRPVLLAIFGIGCDSELTADEVLARISWVAAAGGPVRRPRPHRAGGPPGGGVARPRAHGGQRPGGPRLSRRPRSGGDPGRRTSSSSAAWPHRPCSSTWRRRWGRRADWPRRSPMRGASSRPTRHSTRWGCAPSWTSNASGPPRPPRP